MPKATTFETQFRIGAKWTGQTDVNKANHAIDSVERNAISSSRNVARSIGAMHSKISTVGKAAIGAIGAIGASAVIRKVISVEKEAINAAMDVLDAQENLGVALERNRQRYNMAGKSIDAARAKLIDLAEKFEQTGFDAEDLEKGFAVLLDTMDPSQVAGFADEFSDIVAKLHGASAGADEMRQTAEELNRAIVTGTGKILVRLQWTEKERESFKDASREQRRRMIQEKAHNKLQGETGRVMDTTRGKVRQMQIQLGNVYEELGQPYAKRAGEFTESFRKLAVAAKPIGEYLAENQAANLKWYTDKILQAIDFAQWLKDSWPAFAELMKAKWIGLQGYIAGVWDEIWLKFEVNFSKPFQDWWSGIAKWLGDPLNKIYTAITAKFAEVWAKIQSMLPDWMKGPAYPTITSDQTSAPSPKPVNPALPWQEPLPSQRFPTNAPRELKAQDTWTPGPGIPARPKEPATSSTGGDNKETAGNKGLAGGPTTGGGRWQTTKASTFGYRDPMDNGIGAWGTRTNNAVVQGVSLPASTLKGLYGSTGAARGKMIEVFNPATGRTVRAPIVDVGPAEWLKKQGHALDLTERTKRDLGGTGLDKMHWRPVSSSARGNTINNTLTMNAPVSVSGMSEGQAQATGRELARAMQDPTRKLLAELKKAQNFEDRLTV